MKKKDAPVFQPDKTEPANPEMHTAKNHHSKTQRDHHTSDYHGHGRANKFPFGSINGPLFF